MINYLINSINYQFYRNNSFAQFAFPNTTVQQIINEQGEYLNWEVLGYSYQNRPISMLKIGDGETKILLWSQMHGDEPTATAAMFDVISFLNSQENLAEKIKKELSIYFIAVVNPDGQELHTRRNAQQIDINRDYLALQSPEAKILKKTFDQLKPDFAFNLHSQSPLYRTTNQEEVAIALLAPAANKNLSQTWEREQAMKVIAEINHELQNMVTQKVARFKDEYEPRAFGDNFQKFCPTILIEAGYLINDDDDGSYVRELYFYAILKAFETICSKSYQEIDLLNYLMIPLQTQAGFDIKIQNLKPDTDYNYQIDLGLIAIKTFNKLDRTFEISYELNEIGDLQSQKAFETIDAASLNFKGELHLNKPAEVSLTKANGETVLEIKNGLKV